MSVISCLAEAFLRGNDGLSELGTFDDSKIKAGFAVHLSGSLPLLFGNINWGTEAVPHPRRDGDEHWHVGRVKALWSGIIGVSADRIPWVGRIPVRLTGRSAPPNSSTPSVSNPNEKHYIESSTTNNLLGFNTISVTSTPEEWHAAGYSSEGMAHACLSGRALALHVLDRKDEAKDWLPEDMALSQSPCRNSSRRVALGQKLSFRIIGLVVLQGSQAPVPPLAENKQSLTKEDVFSTLSSPPAQHFCRTCT